MSLSDVQGFAHLSNIWTQSVKSNILTEVCAEHKENTSANMSQIVLVKKKSAYCIFTGYKIYYNWLYISGAKKSQIYNFYQLGQVN